MRRHFGRGRLGPGSPDAAGDRRRAVGPVAGNPIARIDIDQLEAIVRGVATDVTRKQDGDFHYVNGSIGGYWFFAWPEGCEGSGARDCGSIALEAGSWKGELDAEALAAFSHENRWVIAARTDGGVYVHQRLRVEGGVTAGWLSGNLRAFRDHMAAFQAYLGERAAAKPAFADGAGGAAQSAAGAPQGRGSNATTP